MKYDSLDDGREKLDDMAQSEESIQARHEMVMKESRLLQAERAYVERTLGHSEICDRCKATNPTFAEACTADLIACPGFLKIKATQAEFRMKVAAGQ